MNRYLKLFTSRSFAMLLFHIALLFFLWPILSIPAEEGGPAIFNYLFMFWAILVAMLFFVGTSIRILTQEDKDTDDA